MKKQSHNSRTGAERTQLQKIQRKSTLLGILPDSPKPLNSKLLYKRPVSRFLPPEKYNNQRGSQSDSSTIVSKRLETTMELINKAEKSLAESQVLALENTSASLIAENEYLKQERTTFLTQKAQITSIMHELELNVRKLQAELSHYRKEQATGNVTAVTAAVTSAELSRLRIQVQQAKEEKAAANKREEELREEKMKLIMEAGRAGAEKNKEAQAAMEAMKIQLHSLLSENDHLRKENTNLKKENSDLHFAKVENDLSSSLLVELQVQLEDAKKSKKQTEATIFGLADRTFVQLKEQMETNDRLTGNIQDLQLDVEILMEELNAKEEDILALIEDNNEMVEKLKTFGVTVEYDEVSGRLVFL